MTRTPESGQRFCGGVSVEEGLPLRKGTPITTIDIQEGRTVSHCLFLRGDVCTAAELRREKNTDPAEQNVSLRCIQLSREDTPHRETPLPPLTPSEMEVVDYMARGYSSTEIGEEVCKSPLTIKRFMRKIYDKYDVSEAEKVVALAITHNVVDPDKIAAHYDFSNVSKLRPRQIEILRELADLSQPSDYAAIADRIHLSMNTVKGYLAALYKRQGLTSTKGAVAFYLLARRAGLIDNTPKRQPTEHTSSFEQ